MCINKSLPHPFWDISAISFKMRASAAVGQISQEISAIASCHHDELVCAIKNQHNLYSSCARPLPVESSSSFLVLLHVSISVRSSIQKQNMGLCSSCVAVSAALDTAAPMWCFSIVNPTPTHADAYKHSFPEDLDG